MQNKKIQDLLLYIVYDTKKTYKRKLKALFVPKLSFYL